MGQRGLASTDAGLSRPACRRCAARTLRDIGYPCGVLHRLRQRCLARPGLWVLLLALSFIAKPVLSLAGELHEFGHHADAVAQHTGHGHADHHAPGAGEAHEEGAGIWHGLMHVAHCCGPLSALPTGVLAASQPPSDWLPRPAVDPDFDSVPATRMLRPPIHG